MKSKSVANHSALLNSAQELVNKEIIRQFEQGEIHSPFEDGSWLDLIQIFDYTKEYWEDSTVLSELNELLILIKVYNLPNEVAQPALRLICSFIIATETLYYWYGGRYYHLFNRLQRYFPLKYKELNYDYLRYVYNADINGALENGGIHSH